MLRTAALILAFATLPASLAAAQSAPSPDTLRTGHQLFTQSCAICHLKPQITAVRYGPALTHQIVAGQEAAIHAFIETGTDHMPGFRFELAPGQIDLIIAYLETIPDPPPGTKPDEGMHDHALNDHAAPGQAPPGQAMPGQAMPDQGGMR